MRINEFEIWEKLLKWVIDQVKTVYKTYNVAISNQETYTV